MDDSLPGWIWQDEDQLHVTLRFIGEVERPVAEDIASALGDVSGPPVDFALTGVGWFDRGRRGTLFARVGPRPPLELLHAKIDRALVRLGLEPERRSYLPHITLARSRNGRDPSRWIEAMAGLSSAPEPIDHFILFESRLGRHGATYEAIARYPLVAAPVP